MRAEYTSQARPGPHSLVAGFLTLLSSTKMVQRSVPDVCFSVLDHQSCITCCLTFPILPFLCVDSKDLVQIAVLFITL